MSDLHGEYELFFHILNNSSGVIREKVDYVFGARLTDVDSFIRYELDQADALPVQDGPPDAIATATAIFRDLLRAG